MAFVDLNEQVIGQVRDAADIVDVISAITPLKAAGRSHKGLCPFHREKTPSFHVDRSKGMFYCFGCGAGGDVFKFVMMTERFNFPEAVEWVADRVGIELPKKQPTHKDRSRDELLEIVEEAAGAFHQALGWDGNPAADYLEKRGVDREIWRRFGFGYAPDSWDYTLSRLGRRWDSKRLEEAGLVLPRKQGNGFYDRFRNRLMIPIHNEAGSVIGFGGRTLDGSDPKYLNSPESAVFNKSQLLFNLHRSRDTMRKVSRAVLVEGYFDCIALEEAGIPGVVASMGTSLTAGQASLLRRYARLVVICYDGDDAGRNAALRAAPILLSAGLDVRVVDLGAGDDPDTWIARHGSDAFLERLGTAEDAIHFALRTWASDPRAMSGEEKSRVVEQLVPLIAAVPDPVIRNDSAQKTAHALQIEFDTIWPRVRSSGAALKKIDAEVTPQVSNVMSGEKVVLRELIQGRLTNETAEQIREEMFSDPRCRAVWRAWREVGGSSEALDFSRLATHLKGESELTMLSELALSEDRESSSRPSVDLSVRLMEQGWISRRLRELQSEIQNAEQGGDPDREMALLAEKSELSRRLHALK